MLKFRYQCDFPGCEREYGKKQHLKEHFRKHTGRAFFMYGTFVPLCRGHALLLRCVWWTILCPRSHEETLVQSHRDQATCLQVIDSKQTFFYCFLDGNVVQYLLRTEEGWSTKEHRQESFLFYVAQKCLIFVFAAQWEPVQTWLWHLWQTFQVNEQKIMSTIFYCLFRFDRELEKHKLTHMVSKKMSYLDILFYNFF